MQKSMFSILSIVFLAVGYDVVEVVVGPVKQLLHDGHEAATTVGEGVLHARRHLGIDSAAHKPVGLEAAEGLRQHLLRAVGILLFYVAESHWAVAATEGVEHRQRPLATNAHQDVADGTLREDGVLYEVFGHVT